MSRFLRQLRHFWRVSKAGITNAATRALGITADGELASGVYGKMPGGLTERIATLPKGQMALSHYSFRAPLVVNFPRPAWRTGKAKGVKGTRPKTTDALNLRPASLQRLQEGINADLVEQIMSTSSDPQAAIERLSAAREPDMHRTALHAASTFDPENPFDMS